MAGCRSREIAEIRLSGAAGIVAIAKWLRASGDAPINKYCQYMTVRDRLD